MKKSIHRIVMSSLLAVVVLSPLYAQVPVSHKGGFFMIDTSVIVHINGTLTSLEGNTTAIINAGNLTVTDSIICNGDNFMFGTTPDTLKGVVTLKGDGHQNLGGTDSMRIGRLYIQNSYDSLNITTYVSIRSELKLDSGNIDIIGNTPNQYPSELDLRATGRITKETNERRIYTHDYGKIRTSRFLQLGKPYTNLAGIGLDLTINGNLGDSVEVWRKNIPQPSVSNGSIDRFYYFNPVSAGVVSNPNIHYLDNNEMNGQNEDSFSLYLSQNSGGNWENKKGTTNTTNDKHSTDATVQWQLTDNSMVTLAEKDCQTPPPLSFSRDTIALCGSASVWLYPTGIDGMASTWSTDQENQDSIQVSSAGLYKVEIVDLRGCPNTDSIVVVSKPLPSLAFTAAPECIGTTTSVKNASSIASGTQSYLWDFADTYTSGEDTSSLTEPTFTYSNPGTYTITLKANSDWNCNAELSKNVVVLPYPVIDVSIAENCEDSLLTITNNSSVSPSAGILYAWDFDGESTSTDITPVYQFSSYGIKEIEIKAKSFNRCESIDTVYVRIHDNPVSSFTANEACFGLATSFVNTATVFADSLDHLWGLEGDITPITSPTFMFSQVGASSVSLRSVSSFGCMHDTTEDINVRVLPNPSYTASATCEDESTVFSNTSSASSSFGWSFDSEAVSTDYSPSYTFTNPGNKSITLVETDMYGCIDSIISPLVIKQRPIAQYTYNDVCVGELQTMLNTSNASGSRLTYKWSDRRSVSNARDYFTLFSSEGNYPIKMIVTDNGCSDSITQSVTVSANPLVNFGLDFSTCGDSYVLDGENVGSTYLWSNHSTDKTLNITNSGTYWLKVTTPAGCNLADTVQITLDTVLEVHLGADNEFCDSTRLDAGIPGSTYTWSTGSTKRNLDIVASNLYWVDVRDQNGCTDRDSINVTIVATQVPSLGNDQNGCTGDEFTLDPGFSASSYVWSTSSTASTLSVTSTGQYRVTTTDDNGCVARDTVNITINENPTLNLGTDGIVCDSVLYDVSQAGVSYTWNDGTTLPNKTIQLAGQYWVRLTNISSSCTTSDTLNVTIAPNPIVDLGNDTTLCDNTSLTLAAQNIGSSFLWTGGSTDPSLVVNTSGEYAVQVTSAQGCVTTDSINVSVRGPFTTSLGEDFVLCNGLTKELTSSIEGTQYAWFKDGASLPVTTRFLIVDTIGSYAIVVTDAFSCRATDTISSIETRDVITADFWMATANLFEGDVIKLINTSFPKSYTSNWNFGDGAFSIEEDPTHVYFKDGDYEVKLTIVGDICTHTITKSVTINPLSMRPRTTDTVVWVPNGIGSVKLYPNPNDGHFSLDVNLLKEGDLHIEIMDLIGNRLLNKTITGKEHNETYAMPELAPGMYFVRLRVNESLETIKFIKTRN